MRTGPRGAGCLAVAVLMSGCSLLAPGLRSARPVDPAPFTALAATAGASVGRVLSTSCAGAPMAGSGFVVDSSHVLTASHVVGGARQVSLRLTGAKPVLADVVGIDAATDTALVRTSTVLGRGLALAAADATTSGTPVAVLGYPLGDAELLSSLTMITSVSEAAVVNDHSATGLVVVDATLPVGMSGGPVVDAAGRVRGMAVASIGGRGGRDSTSPVALALPTGVLAAAVARWQDVPRSDPPACEGETAALSTAGTELVLGNGVDAELAHTVWLFGTSLGAGQFASAWGMLTPDRQRVEGDLAQWTRRNSRAWTRVDVREATRQGDRATASVRVDTAGPDGACAAGEIDVTFRLSRGIWLIDGVDPGAVSACG